MYALLPLLPITYQACMHARPTTTLQQRINHFVDWGTCTEITLSTRPPGTHRPRTANPSSQHPARPTHHPRPPHMHKPSTVTGLQQFDPGGTVGCKAQNMRWYGGKIFLTFFVQITSYGFCNICATGQIPPFLLHEGSRHPRMRQYQNGRQRH